LLSVSVFSISVPWHLVFNALSGAAIISLSVCVFRFPLGSHRKVSTFQISCLSIFQIYCLFITLLSHFFFKNFAFVPFLCQCFHLFGFNCSTTVSPKLIVEFVFGWFACVDSNNIYKLVFFILPVQLFYNTDLSLFCQLSSATFSSRSSPFWDVTRRRLVVSYRRFGTTYQFHLQGSSSLLGRRSNLSCGGSLKSLLLHFLLRSHIAYTCLLWGDTFYTLLVPFRFSCRFVCISSNFQLSIPKLYLNTGKTNDPPAAVILFFAFNSDLRIVLNPLSYSPFDPSFICWCCKTSLSSVPRYQYVFPRSSCYISLLISSNKFCEWTNFPFLRTIFAQLSRTNSI